jgi:ATP:ADP antiporter, AAA family
VEPKVDNKEFSTLRGIFFPIHRYELKKIIPLGLILFFSLFNHYCLKNIKDSLVVTNAGAEAIAFIKLLCVPPFAIFFMLVYTKLSDRLKNEHLFYATLGFFVSFFILFTCVLYPFRSYIHPSEETVAFLQTTFPAFFWVFSIWGVWSYALFFVFAELWSSFILTLLFWQFVNQITELKEAKRVYAFLALLGQGAVTLSGYFGTWASDIRNKVADCTDPWQVSLYWIIGMVTVSSLFSMYLYHWIYKNVLTDPLFYNKPELPGVKRKAKQRSSVLQSLKMVCRSPYLGLIALLVICYGITDNMIENFWKHELGLRYTNINEYNTFMNRYTMAYGFLSMVILVFAGNVFRKFNWGVGAILTPLVMSIGGTALFIAILSKNLFLEGMGTLLSFQTMIVSVGFIVLVLDKSFKMSFFDISKEMAFIPLSDELKVKGKAIVDVLGYRFGKSAGSGIQVVLLTIVSVFSGIQATYADIAIYAFVLFLICSLLWLISVLRLSKRIRSDKVIDE